LPSASRSSSTSTSPQTTPPGWSPTPTRPRSTGCSAF